MLGSILIGHKALCFVGGVAAAVVGTKLVQSGKARNLCVKGVASGMRLKNCAMETFQNIKEEAVDICHDAKKQAEPDEK